MFYFYYYYYVTSQVLESVIVIRASCETKQKKGNYFTISCSVLQDFLSDRFLFRTLSPNSRLFCPNYPLACFFIYFSGLFFTHLLGSN